ncbi:hypothetical protein HSX11_29760 [Oxalobacteraceae bacterium]|nr:hypothetical protein [Oxalobacteraceae bacterium]
MRKANWTTPADVLAQLQRWWLDGRLLAAPLRGEPLFPLTLPLRQPAVAELGERFDDVRQWIRALEEGSVASKGYGYRLNWREINHRQLGRNRVPDAAVIDTEGDALRLLGRQADARRFAQLAGATLALFPPLRDWLTRRPLTVLEQAASWERVLAILQWFAAHPRAGLYLRQLDIVGVDSKFIEQRKGLLAELLDVVLPAESIDMAMTGARQFEARYGLLAKPVSVRFRMLDRKHDVGGLSDLSVPVAQFAALETQVRRVFITENEINGLAFPDVADSMVIFGGGYGIERLADISWLRDREIFYWGDIDTHGFAILDRLRGILPLARSMLMDEATLQLHRPLWVAEEGDKRCKGMPAHLDDNELRLFIALRDDLHGERVRLEQERIHYRCVLEAISTIA